MILSLTLALLTAAASLPEPIRACLSTEEARTEARAENLISLQDAVRRAKGHIQGELVAAKLCRVNQRMMYVLTLMTIDRHVARLAVDAKSGAVQELH